MTTEKKQLIKKIKAESNKAMSEVVANTFDANERNRAILKINSILADKIKEVEALAKTAKSFGVDISALISLDQRT